MYTEYLYHSGIQGMKWGVRRFQNPDGTWTEAGKARYGHHPSSSIRGEENYRPKGAMTDGVTKESSRRDAERRKKLGAREEQSSDIRKARKEDKRIKKQLKKDAKTAKKEEQAYKRSDEYINSLSDQELRNEINRLQMEKQYKDLTKKKDNPAKKFVKDVAYESAKEVAKEYTKKGIKAGITILSSTAVGKYEPYDNPDVYDGYYEFDEYDWSKKRK